MEYKCIEDSDGNVAVFWTGVNDYEYYRSMDNFYGRYDSDAFLVKQCMAGCLKNGACDPDYICPTEGRIAPFMVFVVLALLVFIYRFLIGCHFKPQRTTKKAETENYVKAQPHKVDFFA